MKWVLALGLALSASPCYAQTASCWDGKARAVVACSDSQKVTVTDTVAYLEKRFREMEQELISKTTELKAETANADLARAACASK